MPVFCILCNYYSNTIHETRKYSRLHVSHEQLNIILCYECILIVVIYESLADILSRFYTIHNNYHGKMKRKTNVNL